MNQFLYLFCLWSFLVLPIILLGIRVLNRRFMPWWLLLSLIPILGWIFVNGTVTFSYQHLRELHDGYSNAPPELTARLTSDGAKRVFALFFGWIYSFVYLMPFLCFYGLICLFRRQNTAEQGAAANP